MTYPVVQFVSAPDPDADVRLDLNSDFGSATCSVNADGFSLGAPVLNGDPGAVGASWGDRSLTITPRITGPKAAALELLTLMAREQLRPTNWVHFKLDEMTPSRWFEVYQSSPQALSLDEVDVEGRKPDAWQTQLTLTADAFALLERVTHGPYTITQSPDGDYPMSVVLPAIEGDAPAPLRVTVAPSSTNNFTQRSASWLIGCLSGTNSVTHPIFDLGAVDDAVTDVAGTSSVNTGADYFSGGYRTITVGAATPNLLTRFYVTLSTDIPLGRYKVLLRGRYTAGDDKTLLFRLQQGSNSNQTVIVCQGQTASIEVSAFDTGREFWVDLGEFHVPFGITPPADVSGTIPAPVLLVDIGTGDGTASEVDMDAIKLVPVDGPEIAATRLLKITSPLWPFAQRAMEGTIDGDLEVLWGTGGGVYLEATHVLEGSFPTADPAAESNTVLVMAMDSGIEAPAASSYITAVGSESQVTVSYHPRKLLF